MTLKQQQDRNITILKEEFERKANEVHKNFEKVMKMVRRKRIWTTGARGAHATNLGRREYADD